MTLYEAYSYLYENRKKNPILRGRFLSAFNYWRNGTGPNEDAQRRHLLQAGFTYERGWKKPVNGFMKLSVATIVITADKYDEYYSMSKELMDYYQQIGDHYRIHIAGPEKQLKKIQKRFGIPKKMK